MYKSHSVGRCGCAHPTQGSKHTRFKNGGIVSSRSPPLDIDRRQVALEPLEGIANLALADGAGEERRWLGRKIARDLYKFAASFNHSTHGDMLVVPANFIDRWIEKFEAKCRVDPGFMMKNDD